MTKARDTYLVAIFEDPDSLLRGLRELQTRGAAKLRVYSPVPIHEVEQVLGDKPSSVRIFAFAGGFLGGIGGLALAILTSLQWELISGGKPIVSIPPYLIIGFEFALLFGAIFTVVGLLLNGGLPSLRRDAHYDPRFSVDRFGVVVHSDEANASALREVLRGAGAEEVRVET